MESEGSVYLSNGLDAYLARRRKSHLFFFNFLVICHINRQWCHTQCYNTGFLFDFNMEAIKSQKVPLWISDLPVACDVFERSETTSSSNVSTISSLSDDESPVFHRRQKVAFVDMQTVASSSVGYECGFEFVQCRFYHFSSNVNKAKIISFYLSQCAFIPPASLLCRISWTHLNFRWGRCNDRWSRKETTETGWRGSWPASLHSLHRKVPHLRVCVWLTVLLDRLIREMGKTICAFVLLFLLRVMLNKLGSVLSIVSESEH